MQDTDKTNIYYLKTYSYRTNFIKCTNGIDLLYAFLKEHYALGDSLQTLMDKVGENAKSEKEYLEEKRVTINYEKEWEIDVSEARRLMQHLASYITDPHGCDLNIKPLVDQMRYEDRQGDNT